MERRRVKFPVMVVGVKNMNGHVYTKEVCDSVMANINKHGITIKCGTNYAGIASKSYFEGDILFAEAFLQGIYTDVRGQRITSTGYGVCDGNGTIKDYSIMEFQITTTSAFENFIDCSVQYIYKRNIKI
jgi:hypothetical protein